MSIHFEQLYGSMDSLPTIKKMTVVPVAGYDSFLLNLSGGHGPIFIRNLVVLQDTAGHSGIGETPGGESILRTLEQCVELVVGRRVGEMNDVLQAIQQRFGALDAAGRGQQTFDQRTTIHVLTAVEAAFLDLMGQALGVPVAKLLSDGQQRDTVEVLGYLFFVGDHRETQLDYRVADYRADNWQRVRNEKALDTDTIVNQARAAQERFGFKMFKLKGGVLEGPAECDCIRALAEAFPDAGITIDPNGCWSLASAIEWLTPLKHVLTYAEDPCGAEGGRNGCEVLTEFRQATRITTATNMVATDFPGLVQAIRLDAVDVPLADCHFWTMRGAVRVSELCDLWGLTWGSHSNNHFDVSLAMMTHVAAAARGRVTPIDTHWIWQVGQRLTKEPPEIRHGQIKVPASPGLGIELDWKQLEEAHELYKRRGAAKRDDSIAMQHLCPGWKFDPKRPCLDRR
ncbi:MAG TPA: enolase C-terminal domain-like protein [Lacipirellulaceae bacterium]